MHICTDRCRGRPCLCPVGMSSRTIEIELTEIGKIIEKQWNALPNQFDSVSSDEFIMMPNHVHGVVIIRQRADTRPAPTLGDIICAFKSKCTMEYLNSIKTNGTYKSVKIWQRSYYEHIIRDEESLNKIRDYIRNNQLTWEEDKSNISYNNPDAHRPRSAWRVSGSVGFY